MCRWTRHAGGRPAAAVLLLLALALAVSGCSTSDLGLNGIGLSGLGAGSLTAIGTPTIQGKDPGGTYAFVYGDQVWIKHAQDSAPKQLTHLALSAGSAYSWGPIVWSPDGSHVAFALGESSASTALAVEGPLYIVATSNGDTELTAGTSSVYGHAYAWYGNNALFYANGSGVQFYDISDPSDPRSFTAVVGDNGPDYSSSGNPHFITYGDIQFVGQTLYATRIDVATLGGTGAVGSAALYQYELPVSADNYSGGALANPRYGLSGGDALNLGQAYADSRGDVAAGAWSFAGDGGIVFARVTSVNASAGTVKTSICYAGPYDLGGCDRSLFQAVSSFPVDALPQFGFASDNKTIAFGGPSVSVERHDGSGFGKQTPGCIGQAPQWSPDGSVLTATQPAPPVSTTSVASQQPSAPNIVVYAGGKSSVFISGGQGLSWAPAS